MRPARSLVLGVAALAALLAPSCSRDPVAASGLDAPADSPAEFAQVADFDFAERGGGRLRRDDLLGHAWVASFLFTRCTGPCPSVRNTLKQLEGRLRGSGVRIVTFTVDPGHDTPEVLAEYADAVQADPRRWSFATGDEAAIDELIQKSFLSAVARAPEGTVPVGERVTHRTQLIAVDKRGRVRGYYHGESDDQVDLVVDRLEFLERETR